MEQGKRDRRSPSSGGEGRGGVLFFIARRLFAKSGQKDRLSRPTIRIATAGVALGIAVMLISIAVLLGFQREVRGKVTGFGAHIQVLDYRSLASQEPCPIFVDDDVLSTIRTTPGVRHVQRVCAMPGMLKTDDAFRGIQFRGIGSDYDLTFLRQHLVEGELPEFSDSSSTGSILVSQDMARYLDLHVGDRVFSYFFDQAIPRPRVFTVAGIYCTNMADFDRAFAFVDFATVHSLLRWEEGFCSSAEVLIDDLDNAQATQYRLIGRLRQYQELAPVGTQYSVLTVRELFPQVFSWLSLLDMDVWVILILMTCVAGVTMISGLLIIILERTNFIGIMKAVGATNGQLQRLFLIFAAQIVLRGLLFGNLIAFALLFAQRWFGIVHLNPETYYMETVPVAFNWLYVLLVNMGTFIVSFLAMIIPSFLVSKIHPARSIRFE